METFLTGFQCLPGVLQGSILGPLLFVLYINDITTMIQSSSVRVFAYDVSFLPKYLHRKIV